MVTDHFSGRLSKLDVEMIQAVPQGGNWRDIPDSVVSRRLSQIRQSADSGGGSRSTYYGRLRWDSPAYTISTYFNRPGNGCFIHPSAKRLITIREAARFQSFPDDYQFSGSVQQRRRQVGNAVPPLLAYQLGRMLPAGRYLDLFCGGGGLSLGLDWAGFRCVGAVDNDSASLDTFTRNRSGDAVTLQSDLGSVEDYVGVVRTIKARLGHERLDVLVGGPPCQGFSTAGNNKRDDPRNKLIWAFIGFVEDLSPWSVLIENVPALAWKRSRQVLSQIRLQLAKLGYATDMIVAHAEGYGVPQLRRRLFLIGVRGGDLVSWPVPSYRVLRPAYLKHQPLLGADVGQIEKEPFTARDAIADLPNKSSEHPDDISTYAHRPRSVYGSWARGMISLQELMPSVSFAPAQQLKLLL